MNQKESPTLTADEVATRLAILKDQRAKEFALLSVALVEVRRASAYLRYLCRSKALDHLGQSVQKLYSLGARIHKHQKRLKKLNRRINALRKGA